MMIVGLDPHVITGKVWETSSTVGDTLRDFTYSPVDAVGLDPGGWCLTSIEWLKFTVHDVDFEIQPHNCLPVMERICRGTERLPKIIRFGMWLWHVYMPVDLALDLIQELSKINKSDASLHAQLDWDEVWRKLREKLKGS